MNAASLWRAGYRDLVSVTPPGAALSPLSKIKPDSAGKAPGRKGANGWAGYDWKGMQTSEQDVERMMRDGANVGLRAARFPAVDIDCMDAEIATIVEKVARETLGAAPSRVGRAPKRLLMYRTEQPFSRMRLWLRGGDGVAHLVEVLADGQQYVVQGTHPSGSLYSWDEDLLATGPDALTRITREAVDLFFSELTNQLEFLGVVCEREGTGVIREAQAVVPQDALRAPSMDALAACIASLPNDAPSYEAYVEAGIAIKAAGAEDEPRALALFQEWAARWQAGSNDPDDVARDWARMRPPFRIGWDWLADRAKAHGYNAAAEEFEASEPGDDEPETFDGRVVEFSDAAMAGRLVAAHGDQMRHCEPLGGWLVWDGTRWLSDETMQVHAWAGDILKAASAEAIARGDFSPTKADRLGASLASTSARNNAVSYARADRRVVARIDDFDADPWLLNTPGGVVDLQTGDMRERRPGELFMRCAAVTPDFSRAPSAWLSFLREATGGDAAMLGYLRRLAGYCATGSTAEQNLTFVHGQGGTGKSVFMSTLGAVLGDYAAKSAMETFIASNNDRHPTELARLRGARMVYASETQSGRRWNEGRLKELTGGEPVTARFMHKDEFTFTPQFKLLFMGNHKPELRNVEGGIRRRLHLVPFNLKPARPDVHLADKLRAEWPQVLAWAIEGCLQWLVEGLDPPPAVLAATSEYFSDEDAIGRWLDDRCELDADAFTAASTLYDDWRAWCGESGEHAGSQKRLSTELKTRGFEAARTATTRGFRGIALRFGAGDFNVIPFARGA